MLGNRVNAACAWRLGAASLSGIMAILIMGVPSINPRARGGQNEVEAGKVIPFLQIPVAVSQTMGKAVAGATYTTAVLKNEFATQVYVLYGKTVEGRRLRLVVSKSGDALAIDTQITPTEAPKEALDALNFWVKGFQPSVISRSVRQSGTRVWYEFEGASQRWPNLRVDVRADGKQIMIEERPPFNGKQ